MEPKITIKREIRVIDNILKEVYLVSIEFDSYTWKGQAKSMPDAESQIESTLNNYGFN